MRACQAASGAKAAAEAQEKAEAVALGPNLVAMDKASKKAAADGATAKADAEAKKQN